MKTKYTLTLQDGSKKEICLKKHGKTYIAYCDQKEYSPYEPGETVNFNGAQRVVNSNIIFFDIDGVKFVTYFNNWAAPKLTTEKGVKVKSNMMLNNLKVGLPLLIVFIVVMVIMIILL